MSDWDNPRTWLVNAVVGAADLNAAIRDTIKNIVDPPRACIRTAVAPSVPDSTIRVLSGVTGDWTALYNKSFTGIYPYDGVAAPGILTASIAGLWTVRVKAAWGTDPNGDRTVYIYRNGTEIDRNTTRAHFGVNPHQQLVREVELNAGDTIQVAVRQTSGSTIPLLSGGVEVAIRLVAKL